MEDYEQKDKTENNVSEPQPAYDTAMDATLEMEGNVNFEEDFDLEQFFSDQRGLFGDQRMPEGCVTLEEAYRESIKHLKELYAKKESHIDA